MLSNKNINAMAKLTRTGIILTGLAAITMQATAAPAAGPTDDEALARLKFKNSGVVRSAMRFEYKTQPCYYVESPTGWTVPWGGHGGGGSYPYLYLAAEGNAAATPANNLTPPPVGMRSAVPLGGLGAGTVELRADGSLRDWNIFNNSPGGGGLKVQLEEALFGLRVKMAGGAAKAWALRTQPPQGLPPLAQIEYSGAYPVSRLRLSDPELPLTVDLYAYSEFRIRDAVGSAAPAVIFSFRMGNPTIQTAEAALLFNLPNHIQGAFSAANGLKLARGGAGSQTGSMVARFGGAGSNDTCAAGDDLNALWKEFAEKGTFGTPPQSNAKHGVTTASVALRPGETKTVHLVMAWYFPNRMHAGNSQRVGNYYTKLYADADDVADKVLARLPATWQAIGAWQQLCLDNGLPDWLQDAMVNSVATMAKTGMWVEDGRWRQWESFSCPAIDPVHIHFYRSLPYALFFPELQRNEFRGYAACQQGDGFIFEDLGNWDNLPAFFNGNGGKRLDQAGGRMMGDCTSAFVLGVYNQYLWSGDRKGLDEFWPAAKKAARWQIQRSLKFGLPERLDNTYDWWDFSNKDIVSYNAVMHLAALRAAAVMAQVEGDAALAQACADSFATGRKKLDELLWTGEYYRAWWMEKGGQPDALHADTLYGELWASVLGLGPLVDATKARSHLAAEMKYNNSRYGLKVMQRRGNEVIDQLVWEAGTLDWATLNIYLGGKVDASLSAAGNMVNVWREHLRDEWDWRDLTRSEDGQPWCNSHYARQLLLWALPLALSGQQYSAAEQTLSFEPKVGAPAKLPWFIPQANGVLESLGHGKHRLTVLSGKLELKELRVAGSAPCKDVALMPGKTLEITTKE